MMEREIRIKHHKQYLTQNPHKSLYIDSRGKRFIFSRNVGGMKYIKRHSFRNIQYPSEFTKMVKDFENMIEFEEKLQGYIFDVPSFLED
jgi:hypothetical protein